MVLTIVVSCCSVPQLYKYKQSGNKVRSMYVCEKYVRRVVSLIHALYYNSYRVLGLPVVSDNKFIRIMFSESQIGSGCM